MSLESIEFHGKKPSLIQIMARVKPLVKNGADFIEVSWGENWLKIEKDSYSRKWYGLGHIKTISADSIAAALNEGAK